MIYSSLSVWGFGWLESNEKKLNSIVLELEYSNLYLIASSAIEVRITENKSTVKDVLLVSSKPIY